MVELKDDTMESAAYERGRSDGIQVGYHMCDSHYHRTDRFIMRLTNYPILFVPIIIFIWGCVVFTLVNLLVGIL
jgi:hypothetical protein